MFQDFGQLIARYNATLPTITDGDLSTLQVDENGRLLVQADVTVKIDFLGLNAASDNSNILIAGTEDGTGGGLAHAIRVDDGGRLIISEIVGTVTVEATDLDIRDLAFATDSVTAHQGGDWNVTSEIALDGDENFASSDDAGDGFVTLTNDTATEIVSIAVGVGETLHIYGWEFDCDRNATGQLMVVDDTTPVRFLKAKANSSAMPGREEHYSKDGRIEIEGALNRTVQLRVRRSAAGGANANASGSIHARKIV